MARACSPPRSQPHSNPARHMTPSSPPPIVRAPAADPRHRAVLRAPAGGGAAGLQPLGTTGVPSLPSLASVSLWGIAVKTLNQACRCPSPWRPGWLLCLPADLHAPRPPCPPCSAHALQHPHLVSPCSAWPPRHRPASSRTSPRHSTAFCASSSQLATRRAPRSGTRWRLVRCKRCRRLRLPPSGRKHGLHICECCRSPPECARIWH